MRAKALGTIVVPKILLSYLAEGTAGSAKSPSVGFGGLLALGVVGIERSELGHDIDEHARRPTEGEKPRDGDDRPQLPPAQRQPDGPSPSVV